jgi:hypothetical protein
MILIVSGGDRDSVAAVMSIVFDVVDQVLNAVGGHSVLPWWHSSVYVVDVRRLGSGWWLNSTGPLGQILGATVV